MNSQAHPLFGRLFDPGFEMLLLARGRASERPSRCFDSAADNRDLGDLRRLTHRLNGFAWDFVLAGFGRRNGADGLFRGGLRFGVGLLVHPGAGLILGQIQSGDDLLLSFFRGL